MPPRYAISTATVILLVLLRLNIGWHFFSEGAKHYADPHWSSEAVLRGAKGPLAPLYQAYLPDFHGFDELLHKETRSEEANAVKAWFDQVRLDWDEYRQRFADHYGLDDDQRKRAQRIFEDYRAELSDWASANQDALATHVHEWRRKETTRETPLSEIPFQKKRLAEKQGALAGETAGWTAEVKRLESAYEAALRRVLSVEQRAAPPMPHALTSIDLVDDAMTYVILAIGMLLILGLFTRTACLAGALFLLSVVSMQPFWVSESAPTFNQNVEMFALLMLATTQVGRWAGLDYFVHHLISGSKGKTDVSAS